MTTRFTSLAAALLVAGSVIASPALAQSYNAPAGIPAAAAPAGFEGQAGRLNAEAARQRFLSDEALTTGSIGPRRTIDSSAKGGNAEGNNRVVPNFGTTSGGPAY